MAQQQTFTLSEMTEHADIKARSAQHWAAKKVLRPVPSTNGKGTGVHRLFSLNELEIAAIIGTISRKEPPLAALRDIAGWLRSVQHRGRKFGLVGLEDGAKFIREQRFKLNRGTALQGENTDAEFAALLQLEEVPEGPAIATQDDIDQLQGWMIYQEARQPNSDVVLLVAMDEKGRWATWLGHEGQEIRRQADAPLNDFDEYSVIRIGRILTRLYGALG